MTQPEPAAQLLNLADRAERGPLTGAEAARLRSGLIVMGQRLTAARELNDSLGRQLTQAEAERDTAQAEVQALRHPETFSDGGIDDIRELYAVHHAITDSGGQLSRPVHRALDALRARWDLALRYEQQRNQRAALGEQQEQQP